MQKKIIKFLLIIILLIGGGCFSEDNDKEENISTKKPNIEIIIPEGGLVGEELILKIVETDMEELNYNYLWELPENVEIISGDKTSKELKIKVTTLGEYLISVKGFNDEMERELTDGTLKIEEVVFNYQGLFGTKNRDSLWDLDYKNGNIVFFGSNLIENTNFNVYSMNVNSVNGGINWTTILGGNGDDISKTGIALEEDFLLGGETSSTDLTMKIKGESDAQIIKLNSEGKFVKNFIYGGDGNDWITKIIEIDEGYIIGGSTNSQDIEGCINQGGYDTFLLEIDKKLENIKWIKFYGTEGNDFLVDLKKKKANNGYLLGLEVGNDDEENILLLDINNDGTENWRRKIEKDNNLANGKQFEILETKKGILVVASIKSMGGGVTANENLDIFVAEVSEEKIEWDKNFGGTNDDYGIAVEELDDGYIIIGSSNSTDFEGIKNIGGTDVVVLKINKETGNCVWKNSYGGLGDEIAVSSSIDEDKKIIYIGAKTNSTEIGGIKNNGLEDIYLLSLKYGI
ncbi:MAG: hypothetical protein B6I28_04420 [Fusobacteriia bacterium 4572_132]|nr:MAG: hypothetical protein B6I28_04420 [Fusobacteriia bacterium 4572_132]